MSKLSSLHWLAPVTMLGALLTGVLFAVGHHVFYQSLEGTTASQSTITVFGSSISTQEANIAIGTALAFLVKASLVLAVTTAFIQAFWHNGRARGAAQPSSLGQLDSVFSSVDNILTMFDPRMWWKYPLLLLLALMAWLIPIASIITPATLSIQPAPVFPTPVFTHRVPNLDFRNTNFLASMGVTAGNGELRYDYGGPSQAVMEVTSVVMSEGLVMPIQAPGPNTSWHLNFPGPALQCTNVTATMAARIQDNFLEYRHTTFSETGYGYLAWLPIPDTYFKDTYDMPFRYKTAKATPTFDAGNTRENYVDGRLPIYLTTMQKCFNPNGWTSHCPITTHANVGAWIGHNILQCEVYHSIYSVTFNYIEGVQDVNIAVKNNLGMPITWRNSIPIDLYCSGDSPNCPDPFRNLTYQAIWDSFTQNILGSIWSNTGLANGSYSVQINSEILNTALSKTPDLAFFGPALRRGNMLQGSLSSAADPPPWLQGLVTYTRESIPLSLGDAMEEMFKNLTVSFMSSAALQPNYTSITAPLPVNVTSHRYRNVYTYSMWKLWVAYGIAILLTTITVFVGLIAILLDGASYSDNFSTIFRVARGAQIRPADIHDEDLDGKDPLPEYLSKAKIFLNRHGGGEGIAYKSISPTNGPANVKGPTMTLNALDLHLPLRSNSRVTL